MSILKKDKEYVWHPFTQAKTAATPLPIIRAKDAWLFAEDGKKYLDANSSWWTVLHGHCHPYLTEKISAQLGTLDHVIFAGATHPKAVEAAERIVNLLPNYFSKVFFSDNGSTSVEVAIKMVYQYWYNKGHQKKRFLALEGAYHGDTFGAMSVGQRGYFNEPFEHLFFEVEYLPFPSEANRGEVLQKAQELLSTGEFAGFIFEPLVQGAAGMRIYPAELLDELIKIAHQHEVLTIADEVMTGFYRTGTLFAIEQLTQPVDIICLSKGLTGGIMPLSMTVATESIYQTFWADEMHKALLHGHSFTGNPIVCSAICASLDLLQSADTEEKIRRIERQHRDFCQRIASNPGFRSARYLGTILSIEVEVSEESSYFSSIRDEAYRYFLANKILIRPLGNVIFVNAPYCITASELEFVYEHIITFVDSWQQDKKNPALQ